jgi:hypothetical protein
LALRIWVSGPLRTWVSGPRQTHATSEIIYKIPCLYDEVFESAGILGNSYGYCPDEKMKKNKK